MSKFITRKKSFKQRGNVLLLALLLLSGGIVGGLTVAVLVVSEIRQANSLDNSLVGYFDAEGGLEQSLYNIRKDDCDMGCNHPSFDDQSTVCKADAKCKTKINPATSVTIPLVRVDDTFTLDIDPSDGMIELEVSWSQGGGGNLPFLEVSFVNITDTGTEVIRPNLGQPYSCVLQTPENVCYEDITPASPLILNDDEGFIAGDTYQIRFKALANNLVNLTIKSNISEDESFSHYLDVTSRSSKTTVRQELKTSVPSQLPIYGFPDYVIFSEQEITK
ncbi:MAG: hypothetical protein ABIJ81_04235 [Patescibacteria group bacterium]